MELVIKRFEELTLEELYELMKLRVDIFVVEQNCAYHELDGADREAYHVFLRDGEGIEAYLRVVPAGVLFAETAIGRVAARKRRCGLATQLLAAGIRVAEEKLGAEKIKIEAQTYARGLYEKAGFIQTGEEFFEDGIPHIEMTRAREARRQENGSTDQVFR